MITIRITENVSSEIEVFQKEAWQSADMEYFGRMVDWKKEKQILQAIENEVLVGVLELIIQAGVMHIESVIVKKDKQGQGIGKQLMEKAEAIAKENKLHKLYLETGKNWKATTFYENLSYEKTGDLPKHFKGQDYVEYSKFL
jgi:ribosomal protein S18 acetylase RimI-like enzyme